MKVIGILCEYNPFHLGHKKQFDIIRQMFGSDCLIVCLMSGNFVQRGAPAIFDKSLRAKAALLCGADLVLELPVTFALSSAEGFAAGAVQILSGICDGMCFGAESGSTETLLETARLLLSKNFSAALRSQLDTGKSFPAARQAAMEALGADASCLSNPNDILAVEYCKAILHQNSSLIPIPIRRVGSYHDTVPNPENPSATALRQLLVTGNDWQSYVPEEALDIFENAPIHTTAAGERAVLYRLRTMTDGEFEALPYGSEGLWRKLMHASRSCSGLEEILEATKSKRYTRTRLDRMVMCALLEITAADLASPVPYTRVLAFSQRGRSILKAARKQGSFLHIGEAIDNPYAALERRCDDIYALFRNDRPAPAGAASKRRVCME